ncbi:hypothetical protein AJ80_05829 [Polytolypa hystricis UAMH7299]|uniref:Endo-arabinase n=1 Tax=Polytolypa hystricis (strain UAMH7299) TaxID=1447883 RepID=A0A2B7Y0F8_POLH7|nr:hypothetical protein AJ80_05829 [Polytolypa hystricis UAMH7299]
MRVFSSLLVSVILEVSFIRALLFREPLDLGDKRSSPVINRNFPDPGVLKVGDKWYAFGTNDGEIKVQVATSKDFKHWTLKKDDALPKVAPWEAEVDHWAPDVIERDDGKFVLYYSGEAKKSKLRQHCVGVAVSEDPGGPYVPEEEPWACPLERGGAIDASGFRDVDGKRYVAYKVDGNTIGPGGDCNNGVKPKVSTPIMLQEVEEDGIKKIGNPVQILDRDESDGPLVEAPYITRTEEGVYFLFYSSHCFNSKKYDVRYATSLALEGPYRKAKERLLKTGDFHLTSPGGATVSPDGMNITFHADCPDDRCMHIAKLKIDGDVATVELHDGYFKLW